MKRLSRYIILCMFIFCGMFSNAFAVKPGEQLADPVLEGRAREISALLRCLVCQNQSIDDSDATLASDLRKVVREQLLLAKSNEEIIKFLVDRYGEFVLLEPSFSYKNILLWLFPLFALSMGILFIIPLFSNKNLESDLDKKD